VRYLVSDIHGNLEALDVVIGAMTPLGLIARSSSGIWSATAQQTPTRCGSLADESADGDSRQPRQGRGRPGEWEF
jgi:hypothetical protein